MRSKILITSAAALLAGTVFAFGQGATERKEPAQPGTSQGQPAQPKAKATQGAQKEQPRTNGQAQENREPGQNRPQGQAPGQNPRQGQNQREQSPPRTEGQGQREPQQGQTREPQQGQTREPQQGQTRTPGQTQTQGQNQPSGGAVTLSTEQRTKIRQTVVEARGAPRVDKVDFSLNVGTVVPRTVHVVEVPETIIEIHPEWRRFMYFVYNDEIIIVEPGTLKIIAVLNV